MSTDKNSKIGYWIQLDNDKRKCSECETTSYISMYPPSSDCNFCPNCGTQMVDVIDVNDTPNIINFKISNIKNCPFCDGKCELRQRVITGNGNQIELSVRCYKCDIERSVRVQSGEPFTKILEAMQKAVELWNTRKEN